jgi:CHAT domain-containing protein/tetratricopeptide (TPR) repeat protein
MLTVIALATLLQGTSGHEALRTARDVQRALDQDGAQSLERSWRATLARRPGDPRAILAVATVERARYRYEAADSLLLALERRTDLTDPGWRAMSLLGRAAWRALGSDLRVADSLFTAARSVASSAGYRDIEAEAALGLAQLRTRTQGPRIGRELLADWWRLLGTRTAVDSAVHLCLTGAIDEQSGDTTGIRRVGQGAEIAERQKSWRIAGSCRLSEAQSSSRRGYVAAARYSAREALEHYERIQYLAGTALASQWYGYTLVSGHSYTDGRVHLERAIVTARATRFRTVEAWAHSGLAEMHLSLGDLRRARLHATTAAPMHRAHGDRWGLAVSVGFEGRALEAAGDLSGAAARYNDAHAAFVAAGIPLNAIPFLSARANVQIRMGLLDSAARTIETASRTAGATEGWIHERLLLTSTIALKRGRLAEADSLIRLSRFSRDWRRGDRNFSSVATAAHEAQVGLSLGNMAEAESAVSALGRFMDEWRRLASSATVRIAVAQLRNNMGGIANAYPDIVAQLVRRGRIELAFDFVERFRAREISSQAVQRVALLGDSTAAMRALRNASDSTVVALATVRSGLAIDEAFVSYVLGVDGAPTTAIVVTRDTVAGLALPGRSVLAPDIEHIVRLSSTGTEAIAASRRLGGTMVAPVLAVLPASVTRLVMSLDGELYRLPFDALRLPDDRFLIERGPVTIVPSATAWMALRAHRVPSGNQLVAWADPRYAVTEESSPDDRGSTFERVRLPRLPHSAQEADRVARFGIASRVLKGKAATERSVRHLDWRQVAVAHFAVHALIDDEGQTATALALSPDLATDGFLTAGELALLDLNGPLIVLSACRSAAGQVLAAEGLRGLAGPFLERGARAVVGTLWSVGDRSVVPFVDRFYQAMAAGASVDDALRQAKLAAIRDGASIADWGAFSVIGDGRIRPPLRPARARPMDWLRNVMQPLRDTSATNGSMGVL